jgi:hypothetical protein
MLRNSWHRFALCSAASTTLFVASHAVAADEVPPPAEVRFLTVANIEAEESEPAQTEYWLGIGLAGEVPELAKKQLNLEHGLVVADVMEGSPAAKAEVKKFDILLKAGDAPLKEPKDLIKSVEASQGKEITIIILRDGKNSTIHVAPVKRPASETQRYKVSPFGAEIKGLEEALAKLKGKAGDDKLGLWFARPGVVAPQLKVFKPTELPKNVSVRINKEGDKPAKIHVKKDDQEWEVTEDKLGDLPEDVRVHVQQFLVRPMTLRLNTKGPTSLNVKPDGKVEAELKLSQTEMKLPTSPGGTSGGANRTITRRTERAEGGPGLEGKLDSIMKKLDQLSKEMDELRSRSPGDKK